MINRIKESLIGLIATPKLAREASRNISRRDFIVGTSALALGALGINAEGIDSGVRDVEKFSVPKLDFVEDEVIDETFEVEKERFYPKDYTNGDKEKAVEALYAEARGVDNDAYLRHVTSTFVTRALESGKSVSEVIGDDKQYSYLDKGNRNEVKAGNALRHSKKNKIRGNTYDRCVEVVEDVFENGLDEDELLTHYFVRPVKTPLTSRHCPNWAFEEDFNGKEVPKKPEYVIEHDEDVTRFYYTPDTGRAVLAAV
ncbi:hypothetical protein CMI46_02435 [Candidatus Pacearchaeota archaeon]|nr:hypothetical protein [Candidatus Pacearchaeota archaeon]|tara:strand:- start:381 stop:1148 length:768 start_codon:yes stop_codon:yes gene_type:complete